MAKGQWFLISAVIVSGIFLVISTSLRDYFDAPAAATNSEQILFDNVKNQSVRTIHLDCKKQGGGNLNNRENLTEYIQFAGQGLGQLGYLLNITPKSTIDCSKGAENFHVMILKSDAADVWSGERPEIKDVKDAKFKNGNLDEFMIKFEDSMGYDFVINASVYNAAGRYVNSKIEVIEGKKNVKVDFSTLNDPIPQSETSYTIIYSVHLIGKRRWELI